MGYIKNKMIEDEWEAERTEMLADYLGVDEMELDSLEFSIDSEKSEDGLVYNYLIKFDDASAEEIKGLVKLESGNLLRVNSWDFENSNKYFYEEEFNSIVRSKGFDKKFKSEINDLKGLLELDVKEPALRKVLDRQVFIGAIGTMETFLSEFLINKVIENDNYFKNFVKSHPEFKHRKFELREIFDERDKLKDTAKKIMIETIYHNLPVVGNIYKDTFKIEFPLIGKIMKYVGKRHDLVHRNGKTKKGKIVSTDKIEILELFDQITTLVEEIMKKVSSKVS